MEIVQFLLDNWQYFSTALLTILSIVLMIIKRKPKKYDEFVSCVSQTISAMPGFIITAEELKTPDENGQDKKNLVIGWCFQKMENLIKRELTRDEELYCFKTFSNYVEQILSTPQKKEVS